MPTWLLLLLTGGIGYVVVKHVTDPGTSSSGPGVNPVKGSSPGQKTFDNRPVIDRKHWPADDICEPALKNLPDLPRMNELSGKYTDPSIKEIAANSAKDDDIKGLRHAADLADSPEFGGSYTFAAQCLRNHADALEAAPTMTPSGTFSPDLSIAPSFREAPKKL